MAQNGIWNMAKKRLLREYQAMHEENFLNSWLREDVERKVEERERLNEEAKQEESKHGKREVEGEMERVEIERRCLDRVSCEVFEDFTRVSEVQTFFRGLCACCAFSFLGCECGL